MEIREIPVTAMLLGKDNPRISANIPTGAQREILREIARIQNRRLVALAEDILNYGLDPSELIIACESENQKGRYVVLDGNRRIASLKILNNPDLVKGAESGIHSKMKELSGRYRDPIEAVGCVVFEDRDAARHWLELKHTGQVGGAGRVPWGAQETERFRSEGRQKEPQTQALDFLESWNMLPRERRLKVKSTTLSRLLQTPAVRERLGVDVVKGELLVRADQDQVARALKHVVDDIVEGRLTVGDVYRVGQRKKYADNLPSSVEVDLIHELGKGEPLGKPGKKSVTKKQATSRPYRPRSLLIPQDCLLDVKSHRCSLIEQELRKLDLESTPNAVGALLRMFLELSVEWHINDSKLTVPGAGGRPRLRAKLQAVVDDLVDSKRLNKQAAKAARRAGQKGSLDDPSVTLMQEWVHNLEMFPSPSDLRSQWDNLQGLFVALWRVEE